MDYESALAWLYSTQSRGIKLGLLNSQKLLRFLCQAPSPDRPPPFIFHVAGTNGKGSVCAFLESLVITSGHRAGMLTSPHLIHFTERIHIDGHPISPETVAAEITRFRSEVELWEPSPTFFELTTMIGYSSMLQAGLDAIILETGLGGRLDSTNAIPSDLAIITSISLDHQDSLGHTLSAIAREKAGIFKPGNPVVFPSNLPPEARSVILDHAALLHCPIHEVSSPLPPDYQPGLAGAHQTWNAALALAAFSLSPFPASPPQIRHALATTHWPARFQKIPHHPVPIVIDGAHNPAAVLTLVDTWREEMHDSRPTLIFGTVRDKQPHEMLQIIRPICAEIILTSTPTPRGLPAHELAARCAEPAARIMPALSDALAAALALGRPTLITGSLFLAGKALELLSPAPGKSFEPSLQ